MWLQRERHSRLKEPEEHDPSIKKMLGSRKSTWHLIS
ncbi:hypothetical protein LEMLEM_LOCUS9415 [Lemmus lemmus]